MAHLEVLSGLGAKAAACFLVEMAGTRLVLDLGRTADSAPDPAGVGPVDAVLLSHQHPDHIDALDLLPAFGAPTVFATAFVGASVRARHGVTTGALPLQGTARVGGVTVRTGRNGHAPGGVWLHLSGDGRDLLYAGDVTPPGGLFPYDPPPPAGVVIADASYGLDETVAEAKRSAMRDFLAASEGPVLMPAPAEGRALEFAMVAQEIGLALTLDRGTREAATRACAADGVLEEAGRALLAAALATARDQGPEVAPGLTLIADASLSGSSSRALAEATRAAGGAVVFSGHLPASSPGAAMVRAGGASVRRWPVHPDIAWNAGFVAATGAERVVPAFCDPGLAPALAERFGRPVAAERRIAF